MNTKRLCDGQFNKLYRVCDIKINDEKIKCQLKNCEIEIGSELKIISGNFGRKTFLVEVCGINYALSRNICEKIIVNEI